MEKPFVVLHNFDSDTVAILANRQLFAAFALKVADDLVNYRRRSVEDLTPDFFAGLFAEVEFVRAVYSAAQQGADFSGTAGLKLADAMAVITDDSFFRGTESKT